MNKLSKKFMNKFTVLAVVSAFSFQQMAWAYPILSPSPHPSPLLKGEGDGMAVAVLESAHNVLTLEPRGDGSLRDIAQTLGKIQSFNDIVREQGMEKALEQSRWEMGVKS